LEHIVEIDLCVGDYQNLDILLNYLEFGFVVVPEDYSYKNWIALFKLADYFCIQDLKGIAEFQIHTQITDSSLSTIMMFAEEHNLDELALACARIKLSL